MKKKLISSVLAAAMAVSAAVIMPVTGSAAATTYLVSGSTPSGALASGTEIETNISGMTLTVGADNYTQKSANVTYNGITYTGYIGGGANPDLAKGTGTYYRFTFDDTIEDGTLEVMYKLGAGKPLHIMEDGKDIDGYPLTIAEGAVQSSTFNVSAGHEYLVYAQGSKLAFYGCTYKVINRQKDFEEEIQGLSFDIIKGQNADEAHIDSDLDLIQAYESQFGSCDVAWTSSDQDIINNRGIVSAAAVDTEVEFTGKFSVQEDNSLVQYKTFRLTVLGDADDSAAVAAASDALTLGDTTAVKKDITLPERGKRGTAITWTTSDEGVIAADGKVTRAAGVDKKARLTATIKRGDASTEKVFDITVTGYVPLTMEAFIFEDSEGNARFSPVDGGKLKSVFITSGIKEPNGNERIVISVYNGGEVRSSKELEMSAGYYDVSTRLDVDLGMDAADTFKIELRDGDDTLITIDQPDQKPVGEAKIYVIGDSTASQYQDNNYPRKGWAQMLGSYFDGVGVVDLALSGRSSLSFKSDANYEIYKNSIRSGDYLIVQFGHNDSKADDAARYTDPKTDRFTDGSFKKSMLEYIGIARDKGAYPILATSISRRKTSDASLEQYVNAAKELGEEIGIPVIDLYSRTTGYIKEVGTENAKAMYNYVKPRDSRFYNHEGFKNSGFFLTGTTDDTHINIYGADLIAQWAADELKALGVPLAESLNGYRAVFPLPSFAKAVTMDESAEFSDFTWSVRITADYDEKGVLREVKTESVSSSVGAEDSTSTHRIFFWNSLYGMKPVQ